MNRFSLDWVLLTYTVSWSTSQCMKKEKPDIETFDLGIADKEDNPTIHELAKEFPEKTYKELETYRDSDRQEEATQIPLTEAQRNLVEHIEAAKIPLTESQKSQEKLEPIAKGVCVTGALRKDREPQSALDRAKRNRDDLYNRVAELIEINESHHKLNGKLQERITELEEENKKLHAHVERQTTGARKAGM